MKSTIKTRVHLGHLNTPLTLTRGGAILIASVLVVCAMPTPLAMPSAAPQKVETTTEIIPSLISKLGAVIEVGRREMGSFMECANDPWLIESARRNLDPMLLYSMALTESRTRWSDGWVRPCPYCLRVDGVAYSPATRVEAEQLIRAGMARGARITDVGPLQINAHVHNKRVGGDSAKFLDMRTNIRVGADILAEALASTSDIEAGLGRYHSWNPQFGSPYGAAAQKRYQHLVSQTKGGTLWPRCQSLRPT